VARDVLTQGIIFALLAMVLWGVAPLFGKLGLGNLEPIVALTIRSGVITLILAVFILLSGKYQAVMNVPAQDIGYIALEGICAALLGQLAYYYALKYGELGKVSPVAAAFPIVALIVGIIVLGERITWLKAAGAIFIVIGIVLINYR
jgi:transporter family protein